MITKINQALVSQPYYKSKQIKNQNPNPNLNFSDLAKSNIQGIPLSYISFKSNNVEHKVLKFNKDGSDLYQKSLDIAKEMQHSEITPFHVIEAAIRMSEENLNSLDEELLNSGAIENISALSKLATFYAKTNILENAASREFFLENLNNLKEDNSECLTQLPQNAEEVEPSINLSLGKNLLELDREIDSYMLLGSAINTLSQSNISYPTEFIKAFSSYSLYKSNKDVESNYMKQYDKRAIEIWNRLALGSSLFVTSKNEKEIQRVQASIVNTLDSPKHGGFNGENTLCYSISDNASPSDLLEEIKAVADALPEKNLVFMINTNDLLTKAINVNASQQMEVSAEFLALGSLDEPNVKLIMFHDNDNLFQILQAPALKKSFSKFLTYDVPPIHTYEAQNIIESNKKLLKDIKVPFTKEAREKVVLYADNMEGIFPDKAVDLMNRISNYYGDEKKKIAVKDVEEFAYIAQDLFNKEITDTKIIYDTGKTLANYYGKETTKKDVEAIIKQIKTGRIGTKGMVIYSKDEEAGSGRKYTAQVIAGEAKIPFLEISASDFAIAEEDEESKIKISPSKSMEKIFLDIKKAAKQNENKTAILYINNFEELVFSGPYLAGYKQAMSRLIREMAKAENEDVNILVMGSTEEEYIPYIPSVVRGFSQTIAVDSPAYNKLARKEVLTNRIAEKRLPLAYRTRVDKEVLINKLVKLTEYLSFVQIKSLIDKAEQIMSERNKTKAGIGEFIEAYLQLLTGRTSRPDMPIYNKEATTSHECGHATNLEVMANLYKDKGSPWHQSRDVNFITLDPRGNFLGAVFESRGENVDYPFEAMFANLVCAYGGHSCEKLFFKMDGSNGISQDLAQASAAAKIGVEHFGFGYNTGKISNAVEISSGVYNDNVFKDMDVILTNAQIASDLITENYKKFNEWFTQKYSKLIGTDDCMVDGDDFRKALLNWKKAQSPKVLEELAIMEDIILDIIKATKNGKKYGKINRVL